MMKVKDAMIMESLATIVFPITLYIKLSTPLPLLS